MDSVRSFVVQSVSDCTLRRKSTGRLRHLTRRIDNPQLCRLSLRQRRLVLACLLWFCGFSLAESANPNEASTDRASRQAAVQSIPFDRLHEQAQNKVWSIVAEPSLYRRLPVQTIESDPDLYLLLVRNPEIMVNMWQLMDVTKVTVQRTGPYTFNASDGNGTTTQIELLYGTPEFHVVYAEGIYQGPLLRRQIRGKCVLLLTSGYSRDPSMRTFVNGRMDVFVQIENTGAELLARTLTPLFGQSADTNFAESMKFVEQVSRVCERNGPGVQQLLPRLTNVDPNIRTQFGRTAETVYQRVVNQSTADMFEARTTPIGSPTTVINRN